MNTLAHVEDDEMPVAEFTNPTILIACVLLGAIVWSFACYGLIRLIGG